MAKSWITTLHGVSSVSNYLLKQSRTRQRMANNIRHTSSEYFALPSRPIQPDNQFAFNRVATGKLFSAAAASNPTADASVSPKAQTSGNASDKKTSKKEDNSNIFLDNLGKIFLSSIGLILVLLLRSTKSNNSRTALREDIESSALLDPLEIDDLRLSNSEFTIEVWEMIAQEIRRQFASRDNQVTYPEFLSAVTRAMRESKGERFTIEFGHLLDRVVIAELERIDKDSHSENEIGGGGGVEGSLLRKELPLPFLCAALSLALNSTVTDRVRVLFESMLLGQIETASVDETTTVPGDQVSQMIRHLQNTCQLVPAAQIVETNSKIPFQTFRVGTGEELTQRAREGYGGKKGSAGVTNERDGPVSLEDFHSILKSGTVCAWGECHVKKAGRTATSDRQKE